MYHIFMAVWNGLNKTFRVTCRKLLRVIMSHFVTSKGRFLAVVNLDIIIPTIDLITTTPIPLQRNRVVACLGGS